MNRGTKLAQTLRQRMAVSDRVARADGHVLGLRIGYCTSKHHKMQMHAP